MLELKKFFLLNACCDSSIYNMLFLLVITNSCGQANQDTHVFERKTPAFFYIDNSITPQGHQFSNTVYLNFVTNNQIDTVNVTIMISEERKRNQSTIIIDVNGIWTYQLKLPVKKEEYEMVCADVVRFLRTTVAFLSLEKNKFH